MSQTHSTSRNTHRMSYLFLGVIEGVAQIPLMDLVAGRRCCESMRVAHEQEVL